jgi:diacylglycerol kinase (ATP)
MRASVIFGPGSSERDLRAFRRVQGVSWQSGIPAVQDEADVVILFGGDGTIHCHLAQLIKLQLPVLIVPRGSGNDFARALSLRSSNHSLIAWQKFVSGGGNIRLVDVGTIKALQPSGSDLISQEHFFCTVAGVGIDGEVARRANQLPRWLRGNGGYVLTLLHVIFRFAPFPAKITLDDMAENEFHPAILTAFANVPAYGGGMKIAPRALMGDGCLDVCVIRDINKFKLFCVFPTIYLGRHLNMAEVEYSQSVSVRLETEQPLAVYADGEYVCQTPIEVSLRRNTLRVIVPDPHS